MFYKNKNNCLIQRMQTNFTRRHMLKSIFNGWNDCLDALKRERILKETASIMFNNSSLEKCWNKMKEFCDRKIRN